MTDFYELISEAIDSVLEDSVLSEDEESNEAIIQQIKQSIEAKVLPQVEITNLQNKLATLFEYEKNYLNLVKDFKEEIKFANALQEDLRKERAKFFAETLREVSSTLTQAQVDDNVASMWIKDLVKSYTSSLDLSANLVDENTMNTIGQIRASAKKHAATVSLNTQQNEPS